MPSATLAWRRLPARRRSAAADTRVVEAILELLATVPSTDRHQEKTPGNVAREISRRAAAKAAVIAGSLAMPPGPLGWLTIAPELLAVWKIQAQMVSDLAGIYGKAATLTKEHMVYCLFRHTAVQLLRDVAVRVAQRSAGSGIARWLPVVGAVGVGRHHGRRTPAWGMTRRSSPSIWDTVRRHNEIYIDADLEVKERALARTAPPGIRRGRFRPGDPLLAYLSTLLNMPRRNPCSPRLDETDHGYAA